MSQSSKSTLPHTVQLVSCNGQGEYRTSAGVPRFSTSPIDVAVSKFTSFHGIEILSVKRNYFPIRALFNVKAEYVNRGMLCLPFM